MSDSLEQAHYDAVYLVMNGLFQDYRKAMAAPEAERKALVAIVRRVKDEERAEMVAAVAKGMGA
jgi:hypothetical protein